MDDRLPDQGLTACRIERVEKVFRSRRGNVGIKMGDPRSPAFYPGPRRHTPSTLYIPTYALPWPVLEVR